MLFHVGGWPYPTSANRIELLHGCLMHCSQVLIVVRMIDDILVPNAHLPKNIIRNYA